MVCQIARQKRRCLSGKEAEVLMHDPGCVQDHAGLDVVAIVY